MSDSIFVDFIHPFATEPLPDVPAPRPQSGLIVRWGGDHDEFFPDDEPQEDE
ncbi:MAG TPA: hypothetical protein VMU26_00735 [Candidatus Polarisedimenticolia bacterium]|nr:hypothetical protein [Candidatus Polarisedimenticolia bacterium]